MPKERETKVFEIDPGRDYLFQGRQRWYDRVGCGQCRLDRWTGGGRPLFDVGDVVTSLGTRDG